MSPVHRGTVFLVDDDIQLRDSLEDLLEGERFFVLPARNGHEALRRMRGTMPPRVAVVDLMMPDMDGWQLLAAMREDPTLATIPVIIITSRDGVMLEDTAVLRKPFDLSDLMDVVRHKLSLDAAAAEMPEAKR